uniref:At1g61320/AtMIF1 LRR domain-containing protein n=1 Tax=Leersia perrieri TaxID=77586 RepID=A0A0D9WVN7_9ORYZ
MSLRPCIKKDCSPLGGRLRQKMFIERVSHVLEQHNGLGVQKIAIQYILENEHADHIDKWLNFAIATRTIDLTLDFKSNFPRRAPYDFPFKLFCDTNSACLQSVKLTDVSLNPLVDFKAFLNLKRLKLEQTNVSNEDMQILISNCNTLEFLGIIGCGMLTRLSTSHPSNQLKHLQAESCLLLEEITLNFGLTTIEYMGPLILLAPPEPFLLANRATLPEKLVKFMYLKHLRLILRHPVQKKILDLLEFACLLEAAPLLEKFELHMWMPPTFINGITRKLMASHGWVYRRERPSGVGIAYSQKFYCPQGDEDRTEATRRPPFIREVAMEYLSKADDRGVVDVSQIRREEIETISVYELVDPNCVIRKDK